MSQSPRQLEHPEWPQGNVVASVMISWQVVHVNVPTNAERALACLMRTCGVWRGGMSVIITRLAHTRILPFDD